MSALLKLVLCTLVVGALPACKRPPPPEKPVEPPEKVQLVPDIPETVPTPVVPTPRDGHPGTITYVWTCTGISKTVPIADLPDSLVFKHGDPVVRIEYSLMGLNGGCCTSDPCGGGTMVHYGINGKELARADWLPRPQPPAPPPAPTVNPRSRSKWPHP